MKKLLVVSSVATAAFLATGAASHNAHAAEVSQSQQQLAETALNNPSELNQHPVQAGAYNIDFVYNGNEFHFESDGQHFSWNYTAAGSNASAQPTQATTTQAAPAQQAAPVAQQTQTYSTTTQTTQTTTSYSAPVQQQSYSAPARSYSTASVSTGGSTKAQFLAAGGTEGMWNTIVMPESGGNPNAVSPNGYMGLGQTKEGWGTGSVSAQTKGMINYANSRYGSLSNATAFRASHGWW
ncbi:transglycosylase [Staphylococcus carnosus]|uniref:aggregation-promoting factor C-terminal-like domain-containing protein n=1 Tax=Staphylococcus carnosus TaxID=1281 RepID=UPI00081A54F3|nr:transglycosylase [Staphylococcus carnosus]ANZ32882.1 transglycosylase [Staphylococcus carnosus]UTB80247.1 transglycosylase [Staphylococcus carnosus]UTB85012.1 transglycosylase [Staphylococcus carnosus]